MRLAGLLLAAGASRRFGPQDKLLAPLAGAPLVTHAARALRDSGAEGLAAVTRSDRVAALLPGFARLRAEDDSMAASLRAGAAWAEAWGAGALLIVLGDMPFVGVAHLHALATRAPGPVATRHPEGRAMVPALLPRAAFPALMALKGDTGARALLAALPPDALIAVEAPALTDIDRPEDLPL